MASKRFIAGAALLLAIATAGCTSRDERAATAAGLATDALQQGDLVTARQQVTRALAARDDVSDYWLLSGRIALSEPNYPVAFDAFESALALDRSNVEALTRLCQLAATSAQPERAERYAAQLAALRPGDKAALNVEAAIAFNRGDTATAMRLTGQILAADPRDGSALITRSRVQAAAGDYAAAAQTAEASLVAQGNPITRLKMLEQDYLKQGDAAAYRRTIARLARVVPQSIAVQIHYAQTLYDTGDRTGGLAVTREVLRAHAGGVAAADAVLDLWLAQGAAAMPLDGLAAAAAGTVPETRATYAAYANALHRPDLALAALGTAAQAEPPGTAVNDAKVARAQAQALMGRRAEAMAGLTAVLGADPDQPRALAARGLLRADAGDRRGAVEDLRHALIASPDNADARLALAGLQLAMGDGVLAEATLSDGLSAKALARTDGDPNDPVGEIRRRPDPRLATRLAELLRAQGRGAEATGVIDAYLRDYPFSPRPPA